MTKEEFHKLTDKYLAGNASPDEARLIDSFFNTYEKKGDPQRESIKSKQMQAAFQKWKQAELFPRKHSANVLRRRVAYFMIPILIGCSFFLVYRSGLPETKTREITQTSNNGQRLIITLSDGSIIRMNAGSVISYPEKFAIDKREVTLTGEAFFEVARDTKRAFTVRTGDLTTTVLGTHFNVQAFPDEKISVTVETGKVELIASRGDRDTHVILTPRLQGVFDPTQKSITTSEVDLNLFLAWKNGVLRFEDSTMDEAAAMLERWYDVQINFENDSIKYCRINGQYKNQAINNVLESFRYMYKIDYKFTNQNTVLLYGQGCN